MIKSQKVFVWVLLAFSTLFFGGVVASFAQSTEIDTSSVSDSDNIVLDGTSYTRANLVYNFLEVAFSETPWNWYLSEKGSINVLQERLYGLRLPPIKFSVHNLQTHFFQYGRWFGKEPRFGSINKFSGSVDIALGAQMVSEDLKIQYREMRTKNPPLPFAGSQPILSKYRLVKARLNILIPELERLTGLSIGFVDPVDDLSDGKSFARMRIFSGGKIVNGGYQKALNPKKIDDIRELYHESFNIELHDYRFFGGVPYTPQDIFRVEGYFLPDEENNITLSMCKLTPELSDDVFAALLTECIVRSLGLPDTLPPSLKGAVLSGSGSSASVGMQLTDYDRFMLKLLYCPAIKPGMGRYEVMAVLAKHDECFARLESNQRQ